VLDGACGARLHQEPVTTLGVLQELRSDHLDGDVAVEVQLAGAVDDTHAASADDRLDTTPSEERAWDQDAHRSFISERSEQRQGAGTAEEVAVSVPKGYVDALADRRRWPTFAGKSPGGNNDAEESSAGSPTH